MKPLLRKATPISTCVLKTFGFGSARLFGDIKLGRKFSSWQAFTIFLSMGLAFLKHAFGCFGCCRVSGAHCNFFTSALICHTAYRKRLTWHRTTPARKSAIIFGQCFRATFSGITGSIITPPKLRGGIFGKLKTNT